MLSAFDLSGEQLARVRVRPDYKLSPAKASEWVEAGYPAPR
jgi:hypothetical protein